MGYTCKICGKTFSRCAFLVHKSESKCFTAIKNDSNILASSSMSDHHLFKLNSNVEEVNDGSPTHLENGALFMVVNLDEKNSSTRRIPVGDVTEKNQEHSNTDLSGNQFFEDGANQSNSFEIESILENNISDMIEGDISDLISDTMDPQIILDEVMELNHQQLEDNNAGSNEEILDGDETLFQQVDGQENTILVPENNTEIELEENLGNVDSNQPEAPEVKGFTKKGIPRKRAAPRKNEEIKTKRERGKEKHKMQPPCTDACKKKCIQKVPEERRCTIYEHFWSMEDNERKVFILGHVERVKVSRKTTNEDHSRRGKTLFYYLSNSEGERKNVCKTFFLSTLGYNKKNDMFLFNVLNKSVSGVSPMSDKRGRHPPHNLIDKSSIREHISKYNPCISHYRREHAPHRKYLPAELSITDMYKAFLEEHEGYTCSYDVYRSVISDMNISFTKLGHEECEKCTRYKLHNPQHLKENDESCLECTAWISHNKKYTEARVTYETYIDENRLNEYNHNGIVVCSMDLQKVLMLPHMEQFKEAVFTKRIVLFNESFVPVGNKQKIEPMACIWHEAISGRKKEDITSALHTFIYHFRDAKEIHIWMDNCASQNKNWSLFSYMVGLINCSEIAADEIVFNYLEPGHTFMSADQFHHQVNQQIKAKGKVYDFEDFEDAVKKSNSGKVIAKSLKPSDFFLKFDFSSLYKITNKVPRPYLSEMVQVIFKKGSFDLHYKTSFGSDITNLSFLKSGYLKKKQVPMPSRRAQPRGVNQAKKADIIQKLVPLMPSNRHSFWLNIATSDAPDLITDQDLE